MTDADLARFNPRARVGRDLSQGCVRTGDASFNPRARVGRDLKSLPTTSGKSCFNPRARVGRDRGTSTERHCRAVSIHAPAWGATVHLLFPIILHKYASLFEDVSHLCPHFRFMSVME